MPSTGLGSQVRPTLSGFNSSSGLESFNASKYLFHNEDDRATLKDEDRIPTPDFKSILKLTDTDDKFPTLSRRDDSGLVSSDKTGESYILLMIGPSCLRIRTPWTSPIHVPPTPRLGTLTVDTALLTRACHKTL